MKTPDIFHTTTFHTAALASAGFAASTMLLFGFIYWQTAVWETARIDSYLTHETQALAREPAGDVALDVSSRFATDLHRQSLAAVFGPDLRVQAGGLAAFPAALPKDGTVHDVVASRSTANGIVTEQIRAASLRLPDGRIVVVGRSEDDLAKLRRLVLRALELSLLPALALALGAGTFASVRSLNRVRSVNRSVARIMQGNLRERLESHDTNEVLDQLAASVNRMLDEIERLVEEVQGVGDDIAHDLRTPLTRVRARLERGRAGAATLEDLQQIVGQAIGDLDQALGMVTAVLRIGQIEAGARRAGFGQVALGAVAREAAEFYRPLAEERGISLDAETTPDLMVWGDQELLFEVAANLLDNAVKFTPPGGTVAVRTSMGASGPVLTVQDSGPGVAPHERALVLKRFHRGDRSRHVAGSGLGLNLVAAILRLHGYHLHMADASPGLAIEIRCWPAS